MTHTLRTAGRFTLKAIAPEPPSTQIEAIELETVHSRHSFTLSSHALTGSGQWLQGWQ